MARRAGAAASGLDPQRRRALEIELAEFYAAVKWAEQNLYLHMARSNQAGMTVREMEEILPVSHATAARWVKLGIEARERRQMGEPAVEEVLSPDG